jgi:hypothetical protein
MASLARSPAAEGEAAAAGARARSARSPAGERARADATAPDAARAPAQARDAGEAARLGEAPRPAAPTLAPATEAGAAETRAPAGDPAALAAAGARELSELSTRTPGAAMRGQAAGSGSSPAAAPPESIPVHVEWLAARGGGTARLQLHPPELGQLVLQVSVRGRGVEVVMAALEPAAQALAHGTRQLLGEQLAARDLRMDHFEVRPLPREAGGEAGDPGRFGGRERGETGSEGGPGARRGGGEGPVENALAGGPGLGRPPVGLARAGGVDLRV